MNKKINQDAINELGRQFSDTTILMHEAISKKAGLSGTDHKYLGLLIRHGAMTAGELATMTGLSTGAITGLVDRLEKKKLAKRTFDKTDRRKIVIVPDTDNYNKTLVPISEKLKTKMIGLFSKLSDKEAEIIKKYATAAIIGMKEFTNDLQKNK